MISIALTPDDRISVFLPPDETSNARLVLESMLSTRYNPKTNTFLMPVHEFHGMKERFTQAGIYIQATDQVEAAIQSYATKLGINDSIKLGHANHEIEAYLPAMTKSQLWVDQISDVRFCLRHRKAGIFSEMGCLSGDTGIPINRRLKGSKITIRELARKFESAVSGGGKGLWNSEFPTRATSVFGNFLRLNNIREVIRSGIKTTYELHTRNGRSIRATTEHLFWTPNGWTHLGSLRRGDHVYVRGATGPIGLAPKKKYELRYRLIKHPFAGVHGAVKGPYRVPVHRLVVEASMNGLQLEDFIYRCRSGSTRGLQFLDPGLFAVHHKDGNYRNNSLSNLEVLTHIEHCRHHGREYWTNFPSFRMGIDEITYIGDKRKEETFDLVMDPVSPSYVANDFVVHNSGKSLVALTAFMMLKLAGLAKYTLVVCPNNVKQTWIDQIRKHTKLSATELGNGYKKQARNLSRYAKSRTDICITHFDAIRDQRLSKMLAGVSFDVVIVDEAHAIKNMSSKRSKALLNMLSSIQSTVNLVEVEIEMEDGTLVSAVLPTGIKPGDMVEFW